MNFGELLYQEIAGALKPERVDELVSVLERGSNEDRRNSPLARYIGAKSVDQFIAEYRRLFPDESSD